MGVEGAASAPGVQLVHGRLRAAFGRPIASRCPRCAATSGFHTAGRRMWIAAPRMIVSLPGPWQRHANVQ